ncbi:MAG: energy transducer TonB [bacterium]
MRFRLVYAIAISVLLHALVIGTWPRMQPPQAQRPLRLARVTLIEEYPPGTAQALDTPLQGGVTTPDPAPVSSDVLDTGRVVTERVIEAMGPRHWERGTDRYTLPVITIPKRPVLPDEQEYAAVWPEEFAEAEPAGRPPSMIPRMDRGDKGTPPRAVDALTGETPLSDAFPEEEAPSSPSDITWEGPPRKWISKPQDLPSYQGEEEGLVKIRFWVDEKGIVVKAIPVQKLSVELEEKALHYIFSWRFEPSPGVSLQEGIIRINFKLLTPEG